MKNKKDFDCVKFKRELQEKAWKKSGAKTWEEYIHQCNKAIKNSPLYKNITLMESPEQKPGQKF